MLSIDVQNYVSDELTHFVGRSWRDDEERYALLLNILRGGVLLDPRYKNRRDTPITHFEIDGKAERQNYYPEPYFEVRLNGPIEANEFVAPEMVCFCDIPVDQFAIHTGKYSRFGLALTKTFGISQGASPVDYVAKDAASPLRLIAREGRYADFYEEAPEQSVLSKSQDRVSLLEKLKTRTFELIERYAEALQEKLLAYERGRDNPNERRAEILSVIEFMVGNFCYVHGMIKVFDATLPVDHLDNFYMEREWRVLGQIKFTLADVCRVVLPTGFANRFRHDLPGFRGAITEM